MIAQATFDIGPNALQFGLALVAAVGVVFGNRRGTKQHQQADEKLDEILGRLDDLDARVKVLEER